MPESKLENIKSLYLELDEKEKDEFLKFLLTGIEEKKLEELKKKVEDLEKHLHEKITISVEWAKKNILGM